VAVRGIETARFTLPVIQAGDLTQISDRLPAVNHISVQVRERRYLAPEAAPWARVLAYLSSLICAQDLLNHVALGAGYLPTSGAASPVISRQTCHRRWAAARSEEVREMGTAFPRSK
jgi:hypothetical protein